MAIQSTAKSSPTLGRRSVATHESIIGVAWQLFESKGFEATSMTEIAEAAGLSRRSLFNYFPTKDSLLFPGVDEFMLVLRQELFKHPNSENLFSSISVALTSTFKAFEKAQDEFVPGPRVQEARLRDEAIEQSRTIWAGELENLIFDYYGRDEAARVKAGFVGALAAQVWIEIIKIQKTSNLSHDKALNVVLAELRKLFSF